MAIDMRCAHTIDGAATTIRCQLLADHDGKHVAMGHTTSAAREAWRWSNGGDLRRNPYQPGFGVGLPWAPDMPTPEHRCAQGDQR